MEIAINIIRMLNKNQIRNSLSWMAWSYVMSENKSLIRDNFRFCICIELLTYNRPYVHDLPCNLDYLNKL